MPTTYTPTQKESTLTCEQLARMKVDLDSRINAMRNELETAAHVDKAIVGGSIILLPIGLVGLAFTGTGNLPHQYAENMGRSLTIQELLISKGC